MSIEEYQKKVDNWITTIGVNYFDPMTNLALLMEEVGEFSRIMAREYGQQSYKNKEDSIAAKQALEDEMADILFVLTCLANQQGVDLSKAIEANFEKKTKRDSTRHENNPKIRRN